MARPAFVHISCYLYCSVVICVVLCIVLLVCKCVLPPGDNPTAVNKYISISLSVTNKPNTCIRAVAWSNWRNTQKKKAVTVKVRGEVLKGCHPINLLFGLDKRRTVVPFQTLPFPKIFHENCHHNKVLWAITEQKSPTFPPLRTFSNLLDSSLTLRRLMSYIWSTHSWCF